MNVGMVLDISKEALILTLVLSGPLLIVGLVVGLVVGVFQAVTQIHEMTLTFIPKILAMFGVLILTLPWMIMKMVDYTIRLFQMVSQIGHG